MVCKSALGTFVSVRSQINRGQKHLVSNGLGVMIFEAVMPRLEKGHRVFERQQSGDAQLLCGIRQALGKSVLNGRPNLPALATIFWPSSILEGSQKSAQVTLLSFGVRKLSVLGVSRTWVPRPPNWGYVVFHL